MSDNDGAAATTAMAPRKRNQYNLEFKLEVANQYAPGVAGRGFESLAREYGLSKSNVMHWVAKKELIAERLAAAGGGGAARNTFRLDGCGRKSAYSELEDELEQWVIVQMAQGERVKDNAMKEKAMRIYRDMHPDEPADSGESAFKASSGWLARFKQRKNLVLRRPSKAPDGSEEDANSSAEAAAVLMAQQRLVRLEREAKVASVASGSPHAASSTMPAGALVAAAAIAANGRKYAVAPAPASVKRPAPASVQAAQASSMTPSTTVDPTICVMPTEWMQSITQQLSSLTQQVAHLVEGQNLLLGMLQRLQPPPIAQPMRAANSTNAYSSSSPARNGFLSPPQPQRQPVAYEMAGAALTGARDEAYDEDQELPEHHHATPPPAKRRRVSSILRST